MLNNDVPRRTFLKFAALGAAGADFNKPGAVHAKLVEAVHPGAIPAAGF